MMHGGICNSVPLEINGKFTMDVYGKWNSDSEYCADEAIYGLELKNANFPDLTAFQDQMTDFVADVKEKAAIEYDRDVAWNVVFAGSYAKTNFDYGSSSFYVNGDSRILYDHTVFLTGFANASGACIPGNLRHLMIQAKELLS
jgi:hypothetical protein